MWKYANGLSRQRLTSQPPWLQPRNNLHDEFVHFKFSLSVTATCDQVLRSRVTISKLREIIAYFFVILIGILENIIASEEWKRQVADFEGAINE